MRVPMPPPSLESIMSEYAENDRDELIKLIMRASLERTPTDPYLPWDKLRFKTPPSGLTHQEWWFLTKIRRNSLQREIPLKDSEGRQFKFALTDTMLRAIEEVNRHLSGSIGIAEQVTNQAQRDRYLVNSLIEEAITSSQLEGASTSRKVAKEMIRSGRQPRSRDERMILNNYAAMLRVGDFRNSKITIDSIREIQRIATDGTLENQHAAGRFQQPDEVRVGVYFGEELLFQPPPAHLLDERMENLCAFANEDLDSGQYLPPVIRAIIVHFMIGYEHPFEDGNGRTARALFYWMMLHQGYWLTEFISISRILRGAPSQYAQSYLHSEQDDNDLTYFILYQLDIIQRAISDLHSYLERKIQDLREFRRSTASLPEEFNHRQIALLQGALRDPNASYTVQSHGNSHGVVRQTARQDLIALENRGLLNRHAEGRKFFWRPDPQLADKLRKPVPDRLA